MKKIEKFFILIVIPLLTLNCASNKVQYIPIQKENVIEYRDSVVYLNDTIFVEIPTEIVKEITPKLDTSKLETSVAKSTAYYSMENNKIVHTLQNKPILKAKLDTVFEIKYVNRYVTEPIIKEVEKPIKYIPDIYRYSMWFSIFVIVICILKFKKIL